MDDRGQKKQELVGQVEDLVMPNIIVKQAVGIDRLALKTRADSGRAAPITGVLVLIVHTMSNHSSVSLDFHSKATMLLTASGWRGTCVEKQWYVRWYYWESTFGRMCSVFQITSLFPHSLFLSSHCYCVIRLPLLLEKALLWPSALFTFLTEVTKYLQKQFKEEGFILSPSSEVKYTLAEKLQQQECEAASRSHGSYSPEPTEMDAQAALSPYSGPSSPVAWLMFTCVLCFLLFQGPSPPIALPVCRAELPSSVKSSWIHPHRFTKRCVSRVILNPAKLTMKISHRA